ncbi:hypothetical protein D3C71_1164490 [compost metagenome]
MHFVHEHGAVVLVEQLQELLAVVRQERLIGAHNDLEVLEVLRLLTETKQLLLVLLLQVRQVRELFDVIEELLQKLLLVCDDRDAVLPLSEPSVQHGWRFTRTRRCFQDTEPVLAELLDCRALVVVRGEVDHLDVVASFGACTQIDNAKLTRHDTECLGDFFTVTEWETEVFDVVYHQARYRGVLTKVELALVADVVMAITEIRTLAARMFFIEPVTVALHHLLFVHQVNRNEHAFPDNNLTHVIRTLACPTA